MFDLLMFDLLQQHLDHENGSFANELQAGYALSQATQEYPRQQARAKELVEAGRFVVVRTYLVCCVFTDAILGEAFAIVSDHATREEAEAVCNENHDPEDYDTGYHVEPLLPRPVSPLVAPEILDDPNDVPF